MRRWSLMAARRRRDLRALFDRTVLQGRLMPQSEQLVAAFQRRVHDTLLG